MLVQPWALSMSQQIYVICDAPVSLYSVVGVHEDHTNSRIRPVVDPGPGSASNHSKADMACFGS